jgi:hypothetical protein
LWSNFKIGDLHIKTGILLPMFQARIGCQKLRQLFLQEIKPSSSRPLRLPISLFAPLQSSSAQPQRLSVFHAWEQSSSSRHLRFSSEISPNAFLGGSDPYTSFEGCLPEAFKSITDLLHLVG